MKLVIPSAKLITPELQHIGKIPAIIYPINQNISFDFFKLKYDGVVSDINIICFESIDKVKKMLANYKLSTRLNLIKLEKLDDLGYSVYNGLSDDDGEVVIHFADTIILEALPFDRRDFFCFSKEYVSETWTFYDSKNEHITAIQDKKFSAAPIFSQSDRHKFFVGVFKISNGAYFKKCLETAIKNPEKNIDSFYSALKNYSQTYKFFEYEVQDWFDIGHAQFYFKSRMQVESRTFNHIEIDHNRGILKKTSNDVEKFIGEIKWYLKLPVGIEYVRPRIFEYSLHYSKPYVCMEYYSYRTLHELFLYGDLTAEQWEQIFLKIKFVLDDFAHYRVQDESLKDALCSMYLEKTLNRLDKLKSLPEFQSLFKNPICIDGVFYYSLAQITAVLKKIIPALLYNLESFCIIHGDFCFSNVMVDDNLNFIKLIDPRGKFGKYDIYGDSRYEFAKILHSIEGKYDFIIKDLFKLEMHGENNFNLKILDSARRINLSEIFLKVFGQDLKGTLAEIKLIESLLFFSMVPLHKESTKRQYAMLCTGIKILNELTKIEVNENGS